EAVYRSLRCRSSKKWLARSYDHVPGFAAISELAYKFIARHRKLGSAVTRLLWGEDDRPPTYFWARRWFLRALGLIYLIAFVSLIALFVFYLSLTLAGQTFLSFQWDILLLETGFLSVFLAPWQIWPQRGRELPFSRAALFLLKLLLFKLVVMSGVVKLTSGD